MTQNLISDQLEQFIREHLYDDPYKLMLSAPKQDHIDLKLAAEQILARRKIKEKLPLWFQTVGLYYPSRVAVEQCSSEITAQHKQQLIEGDSVCDLTGGLGVDSYYFSLAASHITYVEREATYCQAAKNNFFRLNRHNIDIVNSDARELIHRVGEVHTFYLDPARRGNSDKRLFAIDQCEPNILELKELLLSKAKRVIVKISPMADISHTLQLLPQTVELHVVSVKNECKELLLVLEKESLPTESVLIKCYNYLTPTQCQTFEFTPSDETLAQPHYANQTTTYLYEPNTSIQKAGCYKTIAQRFDLLKINPNSHLYVSNRLIDQFPGRVFTIKESHLFNATAIKTIARQYKKANVSTRNFPLSPEKLKKRLHLADGGDLYLFGTTLKSDQYTLILCTKQMVD